MFSKPTSSLSALFGGSSSGSQGLSRPRKQTNDDAFDEESSDDEDSSALSYKPVKKPALQKAPKPKVTQQKPQQHDLNGVSEPDQQKKTLLWNCALHAFKLENGAFAQQGGGTCGCVILGYKTSYSILIYDAQKVTVCLCPVGVGFEYTVQDNLYINFYDGNRENWSIRFSNANDYRSFCLNISLVKFHDAIYGDDAPFDASFSDILSGELSIQGTDKCSDGETIEAHLMVWKMSTQAADLPNAGLSTQPILDNVNAKFFLGDEEGELFVRLESVHFGYGSWRERAILISPALVNNSAPGLYPTGCWLFGTVKIVAKRLVEGNEVEDTQEKAPPPPPPSSSTSADSRKFREEEQTNMKVQNNARDRSDSIKERMARLSQGANGGLMAHTLASALGNEVQVSGRTSRSGSINNSCGRGGSS